MVAGGLSEGLTNVGGWIFGMCLVRIGVCRVVSLARLFVTGVWFGFPARFRVGVLMAWGGCLVLLPTRGWLGGLSWG